MKAPGILGVLAWLVKGKPAIEKKPPAGKDKAGAEGVKDKPVEKKSLEKTNVTVVSASGAIKVYVRDIEYNLRVIKPANGVGVEDLKRSLERNREMLDQSFQKMQAIRTGFQTNRDPKVVESEGAYRTATKNALVARANIDVLIPLINMRGGDAEYEGAGEGLPIEQHVEQLRSKAEKAVQLVAKQKAKVEEVAEEVSLQSVFIAGLVVVLVVMLLKVFL